MAKTQKYLFNYLSASSIFERRKWEFSFSLVFLREKKIMFSKIVWNDPNCSSITLSKEETEMIQTEVVFSQKFIECFICTSCLHHGRVS